METYEKFLENAREHFPKKPPKNLLTLMGVDHYENQITNLLSFFLFEENEHGLGNIFLGALMSALDLDGDDYRTLLRKPKREVVTEDGKRLDLILEGHSWSMIIENKIRHNQVNPFSSYERYAVQNLQKNNEILHYVILSPAGWSEHAGWKGISYPVFIKAVRRRLPAVNDQTYRQKWLIFAHELLEHLENITWEHHMENRNQKFVFNNLADIRKIKTLQAEVVKLFTGEISSVISSAMEGRRKDVTSGYWPNGPRWDIKSWNGSLEVKIYFRSLTNTIKPQIRVYLDGKSKAENRTEERREIFIKHFSDWMTEKEVKERENLYVSWKSDLYEKEFLFNKLQECIKLTNDFYDTHNRPR
ncbi:PD-(D/E)XK nuclease family protein [Asaia spathodeae]|uniref:PD-(D/E)XK nuclease family protein n=1 Tax=Asaia spathodeae TaxID=657016 RepID=A0ABX2P4W3_9PROT|nr:PD-(D/E)XK nuclease family protein [Asaia spathodeae]GBR22208.1 hypothetical protein AA105894_2998 [Asaia spathodeae NBRC 105894]